MRIPVDDLRTVEVGDKGILLIHIPTKTEVSSTNRKNFEQNFAKALLLLHKKLFPQDFLKGKRS